MHTATTMATPEESRPMRDRMSEYITDLQDRIVTALEEADPTAPKFRRDSWTRSQGGYGTSCVFSVPPPAPGEPETEPTTVLEKAGVNSSVVHGTLPPKAIQQMVADHQTIPFDPSGPDGAKGLPFFAAGISLVIHPRHPLAPTVHANYRYFELSSPDPSSETITSSSPSGTVPTPLESTNASPTRPVAWWFGGGADLTPSYLFEEDAILFHKAHKTACDAHGSALYPAFKKWCDDYFVIVHRGNERRGIGGIFFDDLCDVEHKRIPIDTTTTDKGNLRPYTPSSIFSFVRSCGDAFVPAYLPILNRRSRPALPVTPTQKRWQLIRRGRYVEFNLVYDRGTKFGLMTPGARVESILMSLPEVARWEYRSELGEDWEIEDEEGGKKSEEGRLMEVLRRPKEWA